MPARSGAATRGTLGDGRALAQGSGSVAAAVTPWANTAAAQSFRGWHLLGAPANPQAWHRPQSIRRSRATSPPSTRIRGESGYSRSRPTSRPCAGSWRSSSPRARRGSCPGGFATSGRRSPSPSADWPGLVADQEAAIGRWARHIADPADVETYVFLAQPRAARHHRAVPASRFIAAQMRLVQLLTDDARAQAYAARPAHAARGSPRLLARGAPGARPPHHRLLRRGARGGAAASRRRAIGARSTTRPPASCGPTRATAACSTRTPSPSGCSAYAARGAHRPPASRTCCRPPSGRRRGAAAGSALARGTARRDDLHLLVPGGERVPVFVSAGAIEYGNRHWLLLICVDISEQRRLEAQLIQSEKMAAIGQLAAGIAHELRNPLAIVMNALYDLARDLDGTDREVGEDLRIAEEEIGRAQAIIKNLLEFSRESGAELERARRERPAPPHAAAARASTSQNSGVARERRARRHARLHRQRERAPPDPPEPASRTPCRRCRAAGGSSSARAAAHADRVRLEVQDTGRRHPAGAPEGHLQSVLHDQGARPGHRASGSPSCTRSCSATAATSTSRASSASAPRSRSSCPVPCHSDVAPPARHDRAHPARRGRAQHGAHARQEPRARRPQRRARGATARRRSSGSPTSASTSS